MPLLYCKSCNCIFLSDTNNIKKAICRNILPFNKIKNHYFFASRYSAKMRAASSTIFTHGRFL